METMVAALALATERSVRMTRRRVRPPLGFRLLMVVLIQAMAVAFAGLSVAMFWLLLTKWPMDYDNIPLVLWAIGWVEHSILVRVIRSLVRVIRSEAQKEGLL